MKLQTIKPERLLLVKKIDVESNIDMKVIYKNRALYLESDELNLKIKVDFNTLNNNSSDFVIFNEIVHEFERFNNLPDNYLFGSTTHNAAFFRSLLAYILFYHFSFKKITLGRMFTQKSTTKRKICHATIIQYIRNIENIIAVKSKPYYIICMKNLEYFKKKDIKNEK